MKMKAVFFLIAISVLFAGCGGVVVDESVNLVENGNFEEGGVTLPLRWMKDVYDINHRTVNIFIDDEGAYSGSHCVVVENITAADARIIQDIGVRPNTVYRFSCRIKAQGVPPGHHGGHLSVMGNGVYASSGPFRDTGGKWEEAVFFGRTGPYQNQIVLACRVGNYGEESIGRVYFDDVAIHAVKGTPMGVEVFNLYADYKAAQQQEHIPLSVQEARKKTNALFWIVLFSILFILLFIPVYYFFIREDRLRLSEKKTKLVVFFIVLMVAALLLRVIIGYAIEGQEGDLSCFKGWGNHAAAKPWPDYYDYFSAYHNNLHLFDVDDTGRAGLDAGTVPEKLKTAFEKHGHPLSDDVAVTTNSAGMEWAIKDNVNNKRFIVERNGSVLSVNGRADYWCDYPPVYVMILALLAFLQHLFHAGSQLYTLLIKLPNIISDMICCYLIYILARRRLNETAAVALSILYAFNPAIVINASIWGQADAIYTLLALLVVIFILDNKYWLAAVILGIALLIKIQTAFVMFAGIYALIEKRSVKTGIVTVGAGLGAFFLFTLPFGIKLPFEWIFVQLYGTLTGYPYASVNAYNFFSMIGANWVKSNRPLPFIAISADWFGIIAGYLFLVFTIFVYFWSKDKSKNFYVSCLIMSVIFMFIPGMHERYLYATILFSLMTYVYSRDRRFLFLFAALSISVYVNVYHILDVFIVHYLSRVDPYYPMEPLKHPVMVITSIANLLIIAYMVKVGVDVYIRNARATDRKAKFVSLPETGDRGEADGVKKVGKKMPVLSPNRIPLFAAGLASVVIFPVGLYPWIAGNNEKKHYPDDRLVRAGVLLGKSVFILWILGGILYLGMKAVGAV
ncbi:MAG: glycosyltransferase family 39 protein [Spirochaetales bacterium]|nr:glycosyltransferase family 39 protein [Spirochaetales bacterium]